MLITVDKAAGILGLRSRGSLYRKIKSKELPTLPGPNGTRLIEREGLENLWEQINRRQSGRQLPARVDAGTTQQPPARHPKRPQLATSSNPGGEDLPDYNEERALHEREKRLLAQLARQEKGGSLLRREDVDQAWGRAVNLTRTKLLGVPSVARQRIPHLDVEEVEILMGLIREALEELATGKEAA